MKYSLLFTILVSWYSFQLFSQEIKVENESPKSSIDPALDKAKHFFVEFGYANWEPSSVKTFFKTGESSNFNGRSDSSFIGKKDKVNLNSFSAVARVFSLGVTLPSSNGSYRGNFLLGYMSTSNSYLENSNYKQTNLVYGNSYLNTTDIGIAQYTLGTISKYSMQYDHDIFLIPDHPSKYLIGLGLKLGAYLEHDTFSPKNYSFSSTENSLSIPTSQIKLNGNSYPIPLQEKYDEYTGAGLIGGVYRLAIVPNQELEVSGSYYNGSSKIYQISRFNTYLPFSDDVLYPVQNTEKYSSNSDVQGRLYNFSYIFKLTDYRSLKLFILDKEMNHRITSVDLKSNPDSFFRISPLGALPDTTEKIRSIGFQFQIKY
jgi:hypothetical protein